MVGQCNLSFFDFLYFLLEELYLFVKALGVLRIVNFVMEGWGLIFESVVLFWDVLMGGSNRESSESLSPVNFCPVLMKLFLFRLI